MGNDIPMGTKNLFNVYRRMRTSGYRTLKRFFVPIGISFPNFYLTMTIKCQISLQWIPRPQYPHLRVNIFDHFVDPVTSIYTNTIQSQWRLLLRMLRRIEFWKRNGRTHCQIWMKKGLQELKCRPFSRNSLIYAESVRERNVMYCVNLVSLKFESGKYI